MAAEVLLDTVKVWQECGRRRAEACQKLGLSPSALDSRIKTAKARGLVEDAAEPPSPTVELPTFPDDDISPREIIEIQKKRFDKRHEHAAAKRWFPIKVNVEGPIGLSFIGDPHVDDNGCNWPLLDAHAALHKKTPGLFACNIGDSSNNWVGRLMALYANQDTSKQTARKLAKWLLTESGFSWLVWLMGNHDLWNDGDAILRGMNVNRIVMEDWQAQFRIVFPNGREAKIWAAHQFQGHSMWNTLHGPQRAAHTKDAADVYACGHTHNWACHQEESASRDFVYWLVRSRGYKFIDDYAEHHGHASQQEGASVTAIFNPEAKSMADFVQCFADMDRAADYLTYLRRRARA